MRRALGIACCAGMLLIFGCDKLPFKWGSDEHAAVSTDKTPTVRLTDPGVLAIVDGIPIRRQRYRQRVDALPDDHPSGFSTRFGATQIIHRKPRTLEEKRVLVEELMKEELAVRDAIALGIDRDAEVKQRLEDARRLILIESLTRRDIKNIKVSDEEIKDYYEKYKEGFKEPERIHARQIVVDSPQTAERLRTQATEGASFADLARTHSIGAGKEEGGDVGWYVRALDKQILATIGKPTEDKTFFEQLEPVAFALEKDQISQPVKGPDGNYYLIQLIERVESRQQPLSALWDQIKGALLVQKRQQAVQDHMDRLWQHANVEMNEQRLEQL